MAVSAPQVLLEAGWTPAGPSCYSHANFGEAVFDAWEAVAIESGKAAPPGRAPTCACRFPLIDDEPGSRDCYKCGRAAPS